MKKFFCSILAVCALALTGYSQVLDTNTSPPTLSGPFVDFLGSLSQATNWGVATFGIYTPHSSTSSSSGASYGAGAVVLYNISPYVATGVGIDWLDKNVTMPSAQVQFQAPIRIGGTNGVIFRPFAFTGVATPVAGEGTDNGTAVGLFGAGIGVKIYKGFNAFYAIEQRTGEPSPWNLFGLAYSVSF
jgi:hypothetical protein